ncbi:MAG: hypothetical protein H7X93_10205 [Sphingomonadaceae bacterium]|nr:hypothetical protein [Sphingomonadaceae bacterium]
MQQLLALSAAALALVAIPAPAQAKTMSDPSGFVLVCSLIEEQRTSRNIPAE